MTIIVYIHVDTFSVTSVILKLYIEIVAHDLLSIGIKGYMHSVIEWSSPYIVMYARIGTTVVECNAELNMNRYIPMKEELHRHCSINIIYNVQLGLLAHTNPTVCYTNCLGQNASF